MKKFILLVLGLLAFSALGDVDKNESNYHPNLEAIASGAAPVKPKGPTVAERCDPNGVLTQNILQKMSKDGVTIKIHTTDGITIRKGEDQAYDSSTDFRFNRNGKMTDKSKPEVEIDNRVVTPDFSGVVLEKRDLTDARDVQPPSLFYKIPIKNSALGSIEVTKPTGDSVFLFKTLESLFDPAVYKKYCPKKKVVLAEDESPKGEPSQYDHPGLKNLDEGGTATVPEKSESDAGTL